MNRIIHHSPRMTAVPTDLLLDPGLSIEAKAVAGILQALDAGYYDLESLSLSINLSNEKILPVLTELKQLGLIVLEQDGEVFLLHVL